MRARNLLALGALTLVVAACGKSLDRPSAGGRAATTTTSTTDPVDRAAVDGYIDRIVPGFKPALKAESGDVSAKEMTQAAGDLNAVADDLKDPAKRPRGVPANAVDDLVGALGTMAGSISDLARNLGSCPAGISQPRCSDLYLKVNNGQTSLNTALLAFSQYGTRKPDAVQALLYS